MPFQSEAQRRFMYSQHPELAKEFEKATPKGADLPEHVKKMAEGGNVQDEPGIKDATVSDFLLPYLLTPSSVAESALPRLADEAGEISLGGMAPKMEGAAEEAAPKIEAFVKGVQKGPKGDVKIWGVRGDPDEIAKLGYGTDPGSVPEHILQQKGLLPNEVDMPQNAPNAYADGGIVYKVKKLFGQDKSDAQKADDVDPVVTPPAPPVASTDTAKGYEKGGPVERTSLEHPVPNAMMARAMDKGGYPHVTFMEDQTPEGVAETTHLASRPQKMADGGAIHKAEGRDKEPAKPADIDMSHEKKLNSIYKAMGIKKYADGGVSPSDATASGTPDGLPTPNPSDPTYWDQIKAALAKVTSPVTSAASALTAPLQAATTAAMPMVPPAVSAVNKLTGASLPVPAAPEAPASSAPAAIPPTVTPPIVPATAVPAMPAIGGAANTGMPNLGTIFNQDTSKLTAGVNPEDRQALANKLQEQQRGLGSIIAQAVAGLGDAMAAKGGREQHSLQNIFGMEKTQRDEALANFDAARQDRVQKLALQTQMGDNALKQASAVDAYGVDDHLNGMIGAPKGTMKKDLPTYFQIMSAGVAKQEKDADLYMKAHMQAASDVDNAIKNSSVLGIKPSPAQLQASGAKLADQYFNRAKGNVLVRPSDGGAAQWIPAQNLAKAKQMDPNLQVEQ